MAIFRGNGGAGTADDQATVNQIAQYSAETEDNAQAAAASATSAANSATSAASSETSASTSATTATNAATSATASAASATASASTASTAATNASASEASVSTSADNAATSETNAAASETNAANSATAASTSETNAATSATSAANSATASANSATAAATSATDAAQSATEAAASLAALDDAEANAATSATAAANSATAAATSETNAANSATAAGASESAVAASATAAANSATAAATSETNSATSETNAATSETNAAASASAASSSASSASSSASAAATSAASASTSASSAESAWDSLDDRYLGAKASDPATDNDGNTLLTGAMYFDSTNNVTKVYNGTDWQAASSSIEGIKSDFQYTATASQTVFSGNDDNTNELVIDKAGLTNVFLNGVRLVDSDYTVDVGANSVTLASGAALNDVVEIEVFGNFAGQSGADVAITGGSITGLTELSTGTFTSTGIDDNATSTAITIDASENVGIGTSPVEKLQVSGTLRVDPASGNYGELRFVSPNGSDLKWLSSVTGNPIGTIAVDSSSGSSPSMMFRGLNNAERARIDSSGNLLVGQSSTDNPAGSNVAGASIKSTGRIDASATVEPLDVNLIGSDGTLANFRKDGTTVGSIGAYDGRPYLASTTVGIRVSNALFPSDTSGVITDGAMNIGGTSGRFKDLYLSGGVVFPDAGANGTATGNKLDSYEEGTWTPAITTAGGSVTTDGTTCRYTKIGRVVHVAGEIGIDSVSSPTGSVQITLPFTARVGSTYQAAHATINTSATKAHADFTALVFSNHSYFRIYLNEYNTLSSSNPNAQQITTNSQIQFGFSYSAD